MKNRPVFLSALAAAALTISAVAAPSFAEMTETAAAQSEVLHSGVWTKKSFRSAGGWSIVREGDKTFIKLDEDFRTRGAPDLKIFLSPLAASETNGRNATDGSVLVAPLSSNKGAQVYEIPEDVDLADFASVLIHCQEFSKLWSAADL